MNNDSKVNLEFTAELIVKELSAVSRRLEELQLDKRTLLEIAKKTLGAANEITESHPPGSLGSRRYSEFIRYMIDANFFGWEGYSEKNICGILNRSLQVLLLYQNVTVACSIAHWPQPIISKRDGVKKLCYLNASYLQENSGKKQLSLLPIDNNITRSVKELTKANKVYICMFDLNGALEISCPTLDEKGQYSNFVERIFIIQSSSDYDPEGIPDVIKSEDTVNEADTEGKDLKVTKKL